MDAEEGCEGCRRELAECLGDMTGLSEAASAHVAGCASCRDYRDLLAAMAPRSGAAALLDWRAADLAIEAAETRLLRRRGSLDLGLFLALAGLAMAGWTWAGMTGRGPALLALQAAGFLTLPFVALLGLARRRKGATA